MTGRPLGSDSTTSLSDLQLAESVKQSALAAGFSLVGIAPAVTPTGFSVLKDWLANGMAGEMHYMSRREAAYEQPSGVMENAKSLVVVAINYFDEPSEDGSVTTHDLPQGDEVSRGRIAKYATGSRDYHDVIREKLKEVASVLHDHRPGCRTRTVVDTAPLLERDFAQIAGLGWFGKNTMLINKWQGSWFFLGVVLTDVELPPDAPHETSHCGTCTRCLEACPTDAFVEPYVLDARKCISYLTIELRDQPIEASLCAQMDDWIFGCDVCQDVCPWNRKATSTTIPEFQSTLANSMPSLAELLALDESEFRDRFRKTPMERPKRDSFVRNAIIAAGNSKDERLVPLLRDCLRDPSEVVRLTAAWALGQFKTAASIAALQERSICETNEDGY
jgi:epoxyqueuosine reductase